MRNRIALAMAAPLIAMIFGAAMPAAAAPEGIETRTERAEHRAKMARADRQVDGAIRQKAQHKERAERVSRTDRQDRRAVQKRDQRSRDMQKRAERQDRQSEIRKGDMRNRAAWRDMKRAQRHERMQRRHAAEHRMQHRHSAERSDRRQGAGKNWYRHDGRGWRGANRWSGGHGWSAERFQRSRGWHQGRRGQGAYR